MNLRYDGSWSHLASRGLVWGAALGVALTLAAGNDRPPDDDANGGPRRIQASQHERVRLVLLPATVTDRHGRTVRGLERDDFTIYERDRRQVIDLFDVSASEPIAVAFLLDLSGSMRIGGRLDAAKTAIAAFVNSLREGDRVALIGFADEQVGWVTRFTEDRQVFLQRLGLQEGWGKTALHDAIAAAPELVDGQVVGRRALILITDGIDNHSELAIDAAIAVARRVDLPIYSLGFLDLPLNEVPDGSSSTLFDVLRRVSTETGGQLFALESPESTGPALGTIEEALRGQYLLGYYATAPHGDSTFHPTRVAVRGRGLEVRSRSGWTAQP